MPEKPKAYLNWILLDEQFKYVDDYPQSNAEPVKGADQVNSLASPEITIAKNGYLYIYVSNETEDWDVFFDDLAVIHRPGPLVEETHYYPFGLTMAGISSKAIGKLENKYKFNDGTELDNKEFSDGSGLDLYSTEFRSYDPQIGRFLQIDDWSELTESWSPYTFANNNPILLNDPLGLSSDTTNLPEVIVTPSGAGALSPVCYTCGNINTSAAAPGITGYFLTRESFISGSNTKVDPMQILITGREMQEKNPEYQLLNTVVVKRKWYEFWLPNGYLGKNIYGGDVYDNVLYGEVPDIGFSKIKSIRSLFRGSWVKKLKPLLSLDHKRKIHDLLPNPRDLHKYSVDELKIFLEELKISVVERGRLNGALGADYGHGRRVADEHELIRTIEKILDNLKL